MNKIIFICPYFGNLPKEHMQLWLQSCSYNSDVNWLIFTNDRTEFDYPSNVKVKYIEFDEMVKFIQSRFDFNINLSNPYKLCDFKPTYGYIFEEYIKEYDFWGYCDMSDVIFGNIRKFITDDILEANEKIGFLGHLTLYRNTPEVNKRFMLTTKSNIKVDEILGTSENKAFDELTEYSINTIYKEYGFKNIRIDDTYVDISPLRFSFQATYYDKEYKYNCKKRKPMIFEWNKGNLFECTINNSKIEKREILYVHFQKRKIHREFKGIIDKYYLIPNRFISNLELDDTKKIINLTKDKIYMPFFKLKWSALKYRLKQIIKI